MMYIECINLGTPLRIDMHVVLPSWAYSAMKIVVRPISQWSDQTLAWKSNYPHNNRPYSSRVGSPLRALRRVEIKLAVWKQNRLGSQYPCGDTRPVFSLPMLQDWLGRLPMPNSKRKLIFILTWISLAWHESSQVLSLIFSDSKIVDQIMHTL